MNLLEHLMEQLFYYHNATDMPLQLIDAEGNVLQSFLSSDYYCQLTREACGQRTFCERLHEEGHKQAAELKEAYIFSCPAGLIHFAIPVLVKSKLVYSILAGPVAVEYPDIAVVDNLIQQCGCSLNYRKKLYGALSSVPIVEPVRLQYLSQLLHCLISNLANPTYPTENMGNIKNEDISIALPQPNSHIENNKGSLSNFMQDEAALRPQKPPILENALHYIDTHYEENIRLDEVASHVGLNPSYFSTIFKREMEINFSQYIMKKKIEEACRLLKMTNRSLVDISNELGFDNQSYFSRSFKKHMGMSPNQFRHGE